MSPFYKARVQRPRDLVFRQDNPEVQVSLTSRGLYPRPHPASMVLPPWRMMGSGEGLALEERAVMTVRLL